MVQEYLFIVPGKSSALKRAGIRIKDEITEDKGLFTPPV